MRLFLCIERWLADHNRVVLLVTDSADAARANQLEWWIAHNDKGPATLPEHQMEWCNRQWDRLLRGFSEEHPELECRGKAHQVQMIWADQVVVGSFTYDSNSTNGN